MGFWRSCIDVFWGGTKKKDLELIHLRVMDFNTFYSKLKAQLSSLDPQSLDYGKQVLAFSSVVEKLYPQELQAKLDHLKVNKLLQDLSEAGGEMVKQVDFFHLDPHSKTIKVVLNDETLQGDLVDLQGFIQTNLGITPDHEDYLLVVSYLSRTHIFQLLQIVYGIILKD